jgi:hypothetical protein
MSGNNEKSDLSFTSFLLQAFLSFQQFQIQGSYPKYPATKVAATQTKPALGGLGRCLKIRSHFNPSRLVWGTASHAPTISETSIWRDLRFPKPGIYVGTWLAVSLTQRDIIKPQVP